jgi:hypothetical protein
MDTDIRIQLYPYGLSQGTHTEYTARLSPEGRTLDNADVCRSVRHRRPTSLTEETMLHAVSAYFEELAWLLCNGHVVANGYFTARAGIKGAFSSAVSHFDPEQHEVLIEFQQGAKLREMTRSIKVKMLGEAQRRAIGTVTDTATGAIDSTLTPGMILVVQGKKLKLMGDDPSVGVYFTNTLTGETYKVSARAVIENHPAKLLLQVPALPPGDYHLSIITQYVGRSLPTKTPVSIALRFPLTVADGASASGSLPPSAPDTAPCPPADSTSDSRLLASATRMGQASRPEQVRYSDSSGSDTTTRTGHGQREEADMSWLAP